MDAQARLNFLNQILIPQTAQVINRYTLFNQENEQRRNNIIQARTATLLGGGDLDILPLEVRQHIARQITHLPLARPEDYGLASFLITQPITFYQNNLQNYINERDQILDPNNNLL